MIVAIWNWLDFLAGFGLACTIMLVFVAVLGLKEINKNRHYADRIRHLNGRHKK